MPRAPTIFWQVARVQKVQVQKVEMAHRYWLRPRPRREDFIPPLFYGLPTELLQLVARLACARDGLRLRSGRVL